MSLEGKSEMEEKNEIGVNESWPEWGVTHHWNNGKIIERLETSRGRTLLEMIYRPKWGIACYMNGEIQSCELDEKLYHETLVHPTMVHTPSPRRVMIIGGGEGATAREVLKWPSVEHVDMHDWDGEVMSHFKTNYPQWAKGAWDDPRLVIHETDIFSYVIQGRYPPAPYDVIIIDLFEPEEDERCWMLFTRLASDWLSKHGSIVMYGGIRSPWNDIHPAERWLDISRIQKYIENHFDINNILSERDVYSYKVFVPSFQNEACFLMLTHRNTNPQWEKLPSSGIQSHMSSDLWKAYHTWNRYLDILRSVNVTMDVTMDVADGVFQGV